MADSETPLEESAPPVESEVHWLTYKAPCRGIYVCLYFYQCPDYTRSHTYTHRERVLSPSLLLRLLILHLRLHATYSLPPALALPLLHSLYELILHTHVCTHTPGSSSSCRSAAGWGTSGRGSASCGRGMTWGICLSVCLLMCLSIFLYVLALTWFTRSRLLQFLQSK